MGGLKVEAALPTLSLSISGDRLWARTHTRRERGKPDMAALRRAEAQPKLLCETLSGKRKRRRKAQRIIVMDAMEEMPKVGGHTRRSEELAFLGINILLNPKLRKPWLAWLIEWMRKVSFLIGHHDKFLEAFVLILISLRVTEVGAKTPGNELILELSGSPNSLKPCLHCSACKVRAVPRK